LDDAVCVMVLWKTGLLERLCCGAADLDGRLPDELRGEL
jgi:hypothetical protein